MNDPKQIPVKKERLEELFPDAEMREGSGGIPPALSMVADDSRDIIPGGVFVAVVGYETDGHLFLEKACESGAGLLVVDATHVVENPELLEPARDKSLLLVKNTRLAAAILADEFYKHPSREARIHGITGTKGKTTTVHILGGILKAAGLRPAVMGTLGIEFEEFSEKSSLTTPGPIEFQRRIRMLVDMGATDIACEVSAHAGALSRTSTVRFETVTYMNLSRDHGDHFTEDEYLDAKLAIARDAVEENAGVHGIGNARDSHTEAFLDPVKTENRYRFAAFEETDKTQTVQCDLTAKITGRSADSLQLQFHTDSWDREVKLPLIGRFNAENAAAAASIAVSQGIDPDLIVEGLNSAKPVPGRLERIDMGQMFLVVVDYAHAPQPAKEALECLRDITKGNLIGVMGAGGSRDRGKRPMIGEVMARECDIAVITSDNPRKEEPLDIINDILVGVTKTTDSRAEVIVEVERSKAIAAALDRARPGDTVAILGKGHETYQIFKNETIHFDDREVAREWLETHGYGAN